MSPSLHCARMHRLLRQPPFWSALNAEFPHWLTEKKLKVLVYYGAIRNKEIPGPWFMDTVQDPAKRAIRRDRAGEGARMRAPNYCPCAKSLRIRATTSGGVA